MSELRETLEGIHRMVRDAKDSATSVLDKMDETDRELGVAYHTQCRSCGASIFVREGDPPRCERCERKKEALTIIDNLLEPPDTKELERVANFTPTVLVTHEVPGGPYRGGELVEHVPRKLTWRERWRRLWARLWLRGIACMEEAATIIANTPRR